MEMRGDIVLPTMRTSDLRQLWYLAQILDLKQTSTIANLTFLKLLKTNFLWLHIVHEALAPLSILVLWDDVVKELEVGEAGDVAEVVEGAPVVGDEDVEDGDVEGVGLGQRRDEEEEQEDLLVPTPPPDEAQNVLEVRLGVGVLWGQISRHFPSFVVGEMDVSFRFGDSLEIVRGQETV